MAELSVHLANQNHTAADNGLKLAKTPQSFKQSVSESENAKK